MRSVEVNPREFEMQLKTPYKNSSKKL